MGGRGARRAAPGGLRCAGADSAAARRRRRGATGRPRRGRAIRDLRAELEALRRELNRLERDAEALARAVAEQLTAEAAAEAEPRRYTRLVLAAWARRGAWRWN